MAALRASALLGELLLQPESLAACLANLPVNGMTDDSRQVNPGNLFCAIPGARSDGRKYLTEAIGAGAVAIAVETSDGWQAPDDMAVPVISVPGLWGKLGEIAARLYQHPSREMRVIGITGTNGKTSVSQLLARLLLDLGEPCAAIGTLGFGLPSALTATGYTTPDAIRLQQILREILFSGVRAVAMEVSSHGLQQGRLNGTCISTAVFTNLTRDHLDFHGNLEAYGAAKASLFGWPGLQSAVINIDDEFGYRLLRGLAPDVRGYSYALHDHNADIFCQQIEYSLHGICANLRTPWGAGELRSCLIGDFNLANLLAVIGAACANGYALADVLAAVPRLTGVEGRMEVLSSVGPMVILDYAHTPDALAKVISACRRHTTGNLWLVFGCGGDRDAGKRPLMGEVASRGADRLVVTSDNPRSENPAAIIDQILGGIGDVRNVWVEENRAEAIRRAVLAASVEDCVLIAGKGHEAYQEIAGQRLEFKDSVHAMAALRERGAP